MIVEIEQHIKKNSKDLTIDELWNEYVIASFLNNPSKIEAKKLSEFDDRVLRFIEKKVEKAIIKIDEKKFLLVNLTQTPLSKIGKKKILLYPKISVLVESRNESIKNFSKFNGSFFKDFLFFIGKYTLYITLGLTVYGYNEGYDFEKEYNKYSPIVNEQFQKNKTIVEKELRKKYNEADTLKDEMVDSYNKNVNIRE